VQKPIKSRSCSTVFIHPKPFWNIPSTIDVCENIVDSLVTIHVKFIADQRLADGLLGWALDPSASRALLRIRKDQIDLVFGPLLLSSQSQFFQQEIVSPSYLRRDPHRTLAHILGKNMLTRHLPNCCKSAFATGHFDVRKHGRNLLIHQRVGRSCQVFVCTYLWRRAKKR
jgi:hypothetical protein